MRLYCHPSPRFTAVKLGFWRHDKVKHKITRHVSRSRFSTQSQVPASSWELNLSSVARTVVAEVSVAAPCLLFTSSSSVSRAKLHTLEVMVGLWAGKSFTYCVPQYCSNWCGSYHCGLSVSRARNAPESWAWTCTRIPSCAYVQETEPHHSLQGRKPYASSSCARRAPGEYVSVLVRACH